MTGWLNGGKINTASNGGLALIGTSNESINMAGYPLLSLGAALPGTTYSGVLTPAGTTYYLGGGGGTLTFTPNLTGAERGRRKRWNGGPHRFEHLYRRHDGIQRHAEDP